MKTIFFQVNLVVLKESRVYKILAVGEISGIKVVLLCVDPSRSQIWLFDAIIDIESMLNSLLIIQGSMIAST